MHFTHWRSFQAVALEGSFTGAAKRLGRSQPTITRQVGELEEAFGVELFHRRNRQVELSAVGKALLAITERLFTTSDEAVDLLQAAGALQTGHLRISAVNPLDIIGVIAVFAEGYPAVTISLRICNSDEARKALFDFRTDVAMLASSTTDRRLHSVPFGSRSLSVYVNKQHPWNGLRSVRFSQLASQRILLRETGSQTRQIFEEACGAAKLVPNIVMEINNRDAFREAVAQGLGVGVVGARGLASDERLREIAISDCDVRMQREIACLQERSHARMIRAFLEIASVAT